MPETLPPPPSLPPSGRLLDGPHTAARLPWNALADEIALVLRDPSVRVPARLVLPLGGGGSLFVMPATDAHVAMTKLISFTPANAGTDRPTIQGDVVVFDVASGTRRLVLDGPTVTAHRTAAVSLLAARLMAPKPQGPLLIVGAGVQGLAHLQGFVLGLGVRDVVVASRSSASAEALAEQARQLGARARTTDDPDAALAECPLVVTCTPAGAVVLRGLPRADAFMAAVGAFTPAMAELSPALCRHFVQAGSVVVDTVDAVHEAGDLLQADIDVGALATLGDVMRGVRVPGPGPVLFKSCGWGGWDLAAARLALRT
ncbi:ornithine cyclodeaminase [Acidovorax sp. SRB_14]|uniref:delta(1)-pyrroline-2-carboxylate reductase family protein n=1 Tax=unclassified Acidovorax TaxID=2684926 RepID=UPI00145F16B7|nr:MULTISPECIES: delta(1)-pyrroline-2-carboxylate reductase family protein [unclassified Acidovorax]NMM76870.1 ornithine cyclodeaminase [Acidovorax sp. SRB_24]NMM79940.1 ornithine cyclodeaminase [Acidovorax sp. SRB_14]NMM87320.1 ornithine cyclodeaminase [Rhodococcus sp. SRB_17]